MNSFGWSTLIARLRGGYRSLTQPHDKEPLQTIEKDSDSTDAPLLESASISSDNKRRWRWGAITLGLSLLFLAISPLIYLRSGAKAQTDTPELYPSNACYCGKNTTEARQLNCKFDILAAAWLPSRCRNDSLTDEFRRAGPVDNEGKWKYYSDSNMTQEIDELEIAELANDEEKVFFASYDWHMMHCLYYWQKQIYAVESNGEIIVEARYANMGHIRHCTAQFMHKLDSSAGVALDSS